MDGIGLAFQQGFGFQDDVIPYPVACMASARLMDSLRQVFGRDAHTGGIIGDAFLLPVMLLHQLQKAVEELLLAVSRFFRPASLLFRMAGHPLFAVAEQHLHVAVQGFAGKLIIRLLHLATHGAIDGKRFFHFLGQDGKYQLVTQILLKLNGEAHVRALFIVMPHVGYHRHLAIGTYL